jgi:hypothetical protein
MRPPIPFNEEDPAPSPGIVGIGVNDGNEVVIVPITSMLLLTSETGVPEIVIAGALGVNFLPPIEMPLERRSMAWPFIVVNLSAFKGEGGSKTDIELVPINRFDWPNGMGVPDTVTGGTPGIKTLLSMVTPCGRTVTGWFPAVIRAEDEGLGKRS